MMNANRTSKGMDGPMVIKDTIGEKKKGKIEKTITKKMIIQEKPPKKVVKQYLKNLVAELESSDSDCD